MLGRSLLLKAGGAAFAAPGSDPFFSSVSLLLHGNGADGSTTIIDSSSRPKTVTAVGNARISTAQSKFDGGSIAIGENGSYLRLDGSSEFAFSGGWTIEFFYYASGTSKTYETIFDTRASGQALANAIAIYHNGSSSQIVCESGGALVSINAFTLNQWHHLAFSKVGNTLRGFLNGFQSGPAATHTASIIVSPNRPLIGANLNLLFSLGGYLDEFRIVADWGYVDNFPVPTAPFADA